MLRVIKSNYILGTAVGLCVIDFAVKHWLISPGDRFINSGVAFGSGSGYLVIIGLIALMAIVKRFWSRFLPYWLGILLAVLANLSDRLFFGGVVDYLHLGPLVFNLSDITIVGLILLISLESIN